MGIEEKVRKKGKVQIFLPLVSGSMGWKEVKGGECFVESSKSEGCGWLKKGEQALQRERRIYLKNSKVEKRGGNMIRTQAYYEKRYEGKRGGERR